RGDVAAYMATHAVGQDREVLSDIGGVVIFLADSSDVGLGGKFKLQSHRLSLQFQDSLPDADTLPRLNCLGAGQLAVSYEGSVGGTEVFNEPARALREQAGMASRGVVVFQDHSGILGAAEEDRLTLQGDGAPGQGTLE